MGYAGVYLFFLFLLQNIDCGYSLELPQRGGSNVYPQSMFLGKNKKNIKDFLMKFSIFTEEKNLCILHGQVLVMSCFLNRRIDFTISFGYILKQNLNYSQILNNTFHAQNLITGTIF